MNYSHLLRRQGNCHDSAGSALPLYQWCIPKAIWVLAASALLALSSASVYAQDESNSLSGATVVDFADWAWQRSTVGDTDAADWFGYKILRTGTLDVNLIPIDSDVDLEVWKNGNREGVSDNQDIETDTVRGVRVDVDDTVHIHAVGLNSSSRYLIDLNLIGAPTLGNISAIGDAGSLTPYTGCTIIDDPSATIIILAEESDSGVDTDLFFAPVNIAAADVRADSSVFHNDDFPDVVPVVNRRLGSARDSALSVTGISGAWCAHVFSLGTPGRVNLQINDAKLF